MVPDLLMATFTDLARPRLCRCYLEVIWRKLRVTRKIETWLSES